MKSWALLLGALATAVPVCAMAQVNVQALVVNGPRDAILGQSVTLSGRLRLTAPVARTIRCRFVLANLDGAVTGAPVVATIDLPSVTPNVPQDFSRQVTLPSMPRGTFRWALEFDPADALPETNEFDNVVVASLPVSLRRAGADLAVDSVVLTTPSVEAGQAVSADVTVSNHGENGTIFQVALVISAQEVASNSAARLAVADIFVAAGTSEVLTLTGPTDAGLSAGQYYVGAVADPDDAFIEGQESDNVGVSPTPLTVIKRPLELLTTTLPAARVGRQYFGALHARGGDGAPLFRVSSGTLPPALSLRPLAGAPTVAVVGGRPNQSGTYTFEITASSAGEESSQSFTLNVDRSDQPLIVITEVLSGGFTQLPYEQLLVAGGGEAPYVWALIPAEGELPVGLDLSPDGLITGVPQTAGRFGFTLRVTDALSMASSREFEINIDSAVDVGIVSTELAPITVGQPVEVPLVAMGGMPPYRWTALSPPPPGTTLTEQGVLVGTADAVGRWPIRVEVRDSSRTQNSDTALVVLVMADDGALRLAPEALPSGLVQQLYEERLRVEGGEPPFSWRLVPGTELPSGFFIEPGDGVDVKTRTGEVVPVGEARIYGLTPFEQAVGFAVRVEDARGRRVEKTYGLLIDFLGSGDGGGGGCSATGPESLAPLGLLLLALPFRRRRRT